MAVAGAGTEADPQAVVVEGSHQDEPEQLRIEEAAVAAVQQIVAAEAEADPQAQS